MDNMTEAMRVAGSVLMFVMGLSVAILSYGQVRETADIILDYRDRETMYIDSSLYYEATENSALKLERTVGLETIVPAIYRAYLENYKIVFDGLGSEPIYTIKKNIGPDIQKYDLDLEPNTGTDDENVSLADDTDKAEFLRGILYKKFDVGKNENDFEAKFGVELPSEGLYNRLKNLIENQNKVIKEYLGVYYQDDKADVPDVNKTEKRIITYKIQ